MTMDEMAAIELCRNGNRQLKFAHCCKGSLGIGYGAHEISAKSDENLCGPILHCRNGLDGMVAPFARRFETENVPHPVQIGLRGLFIDPDGPVALDVGMAPHR